MAPKSKEQFNEIRKKSKENIMQVAMDLFAHNGFHNTSISKIAKEAGVSKGLLYNYFESKHALLEAIVKEAFDIGDQVLESGFQIDGDPKLQLRTIIKTAFQLVKGNQEYWRLLLQLSLQPEVFEDMQAFLAGENVKQFQVLVNIFERMGTANPEKEARLTAAAMDGTFIQFMYTPNYPLDEMAESIIEKFTK